MSNNCQTCPYKDCSNIPPSKTFKSPIAIVGMAPGTEELSKRKPFVGRSGDLLHQTLTKSNFNIESFITNALLCMPPDDKNINRQAIEKCRPRLINELQQVQPKIILALGNIAIHALTQNYKLKISQIHSKPIKSNLGLIIPIYHPAKILRNPGDYKTFLNGFIYAKELLDKSTIAIKNPGRTNYILANKQNIKSIIDFLLTHKILSCDIETTSLDPRKAKILVVGFGYTKNEVIIFPSEFLPDIKVLLSNCLVKTCREIAEKLPRNCYQRGQYDTIVLSENGIETEVDHDTILQHYCLNENEGGHDLKTLARHFLGAEQYDKNIDKANMIDLPKDKLCVYLAKDCDYTLQLCNLFLPLIEQDPNLNKLYYQILIPGINLLRRMTQKGFYVDKNYLITYKATTQTELDILKSKVINTLGLLWNRSDYLEQTGAKSAPKILNPNSHQQLAWIVYDRLRIIPKIKKKVKRSTDKEVVASIINRHKGFEWLAKYKVKEKFMNTYIKGIEKKLDDDNRLRSTFSLQTTVTGRLSSAKPNIQNIPKNPEVKNIFVAPLSKILIAADYSQVELRLLAHFSKDPFLLECFRQGKDLHDEMAKEIFGKNFTDKERDRIKTLNFGIIYGITAFTIAQRFNISRREAQSIINRWFQRAPLAKEYLDNCEKQLLTGIPFLTPFGRYRRYGVISSDDSLKNESKNFAIQSCGSDLTLISAINLEKPLLNFDAFSVNIIHDELLTESFNDRSKVEKIIDLTNETMMQTPKDWLNPEIDFPVDIKVGFKWGDMKKVDIKTKQIIL